MLNNYTAIKQYWGLECPKGSKFYICEKTWAEFIGYCGMDPCADGSGLCRDLAPMIRDDPEYKGMREQGCLPPSKFYRYGSKRHFIGCCDMDVDGSGCPPEGLGTAILSHKEKKRRLFLYPEGLNVTLPSSSNTPLHPPPTLPPSSPRILVHAEQSSRNISLMKPEAVAGICSGILIASLVCLGIIAKYWLVRTYNILRPDANLIPIRKNSQVKPTNMQAYSSIRTQESNEITDIIGPVPDPSKNKATIADPTSQSRPKTLKQADIITFIVWVWNIVLTLAPICFIALAIVVVDLDGHVKSSYGQKVLELTRLSPSLYPILFAAIAGRFYKNLARYWLEQSGGVRLAVLEQVFGSQSFATALERVFFVHTHMFLSVMILATWALSPLGGQSSSRILGFGNATEVSNRTIHYIHPAHQVSSYLNQRTLVATKSSVTALYSSSLLSSFQQKHFPRDMWDLPKIPQLRRDEKVGETFVVDHDALESGREHYASLLGVTLRGLGPSQGVTEHNLTMQTSYINLDCSLMNDTSDMHMYVKQTTYLPSPSFEGATIVILSPLPWRDWEKLHDPPPLQLLYFIEYNPGGFEEDNFWSGINCTMRTVWLETDIHCGPHPSATSCYAYQQRLKDILPANRLPRMMGKNLQALRLGINFWSEISGDVGFGRPLATENFIMGELHPYAGQQYRNWRDMDPAIFPGQVSKRLTTAFNTFWDATLNPLEHTNVSFGNFESNNTANEDVFNAEPFMNSTIGTMTRTFEVYRASQLWVAILLTTTMFLQILAILGLILEGLIVGPEVLGFASSLTRDNPHVPVPPGNSGVGGAQRARLFGDLRLQLADVEPGEENGYIAVHSLQNNNVEKISGEDSEEHTGTDEASGRVSTRPLGRERLYR